MIAVDSNLLIYASRADSAFHGAARVAIASLSQGARPWAIPWPCAYEFLRNVTHPGIYKKPTPMLEALAELSTLAASPAARFLGYGTEHRAIFFETIVRAGAAGNPVYDASIAAICLEHRVEEFWTANDKHFRRFPGLRVRNPLL